MPTHVSAFCKTLNLMTDHVASHMIIYVVDIQPRLTRTHTDLLTRIPRETGVFLAGFVGNHENCIFLQWSTSNLPLHNLSRTLWNWCYWCVLVTRAAVAVMLAAPNAPIAISCTQTPQKKGQFQSGTLNTDKKHGNFLLDNSDGHKTDVFLRWLTVLFYGVATKKKWHQNHRGNGNRSTLAARIQHPWACGTRQTQFQTTLDVAAYSVISRERLPKNRFCGFPTQPPPFSRGIRVKSYVDKVGNAWYNAYS